MIGPLPMTQLSPQKQKKRRQQLREAQRRRRARLKEENKSFLQIILGDESLRLLREHSERCGKPMHIAAAELLRAALKRPQGETEWMGRLNREGECPLETPPDPVFYDGQLDLFERT
jgi:hypothetical protein